MIARKGKMNNQLTNAINLLHDSKISSNLNNEQIKAITILEGAYLDLQLEYTNKLSRRNMQIKAQKERILNVLSLINNPDNFDLKQQEQLLKALKLWRTNR